MGADLRNEDLIGGPADPHSSFRARCPAFPRTNRAFPEHLAEFNSALP